MTDIELQADRHEAEERTRIFENLVQEYMEETGCPRFVAEVMADRCMGARAEIF